jgi:hypothetical protein
MRRRWCELSYLSGRLRVAVGEEVARLHYFFPRGGGPAEGGRCGANNVGYLLRFPTPWGSSVAPWWLAGSFLLSSPAGRFSVGRCQVAWAPPRPATRTPFIIPARLPPTSKHHGPDKGPSQPGLTLQDQCGCRERSVFWAARPPGVCLPRARVCCRRRRRTG